MCSLSIASLNVNGLTTPKKRGIILQKLKKENIQLALLQETHLNDQEHEKLKKLGFRNTYYSSYKQSRKRGVAILISNRTQFETDKVIKGKDGQYIIVKGRMGDAVLTIVNVYAPPESDKQFFKSLFNVIAEEAEGILICGGDFNVALNFKLDTTSKHKHKKAIAKFVKLSMEELGLLDVWRSLNPRKKAYTHYSASHKVHSRIDYFFVFKSDINRVEECKIEGADVSDHNIQHMKINISNRKKQTTWRLNVGILNNETIIKDIKADIKQYMDDNDNGAVDPTVLWDALKAVIRGKLIAKTAWLRKKRIQKYEEYSVKLKELEQQLINKNTTEIYQQIQNIKKQINHILEDEIEKKMIYFKQSYQEVGPKSTKLLAKRIKKQQTLNTIYEILDPETNKVTNNPEEIERIFTNYYKKLYSQPPSACEQDKRSFLENMDLPFIGLNQNKLLTAEITSEEILKTISSLKNNKSPGSDGFPAEWYKIFKDELTPILHKSLNWTLQNNKMPISWSEAIISVLLKPGKNKQSCANYRPISVLNIDYKIYTSIICNRINTFLPDIIDEDQTGFIKSRQTHDNIRRTLHLTERAQREHISTVLLSIDAEKAFDCVNWEFLFLVLEKMGFNNKSVEIIKTIYSQPTAKLKINGNLTGTFKLERSTRQGCGLSPTLFALFIEPLAQAIREKPEIKGVSMNGVEHKIGLFADDLIAYLEQPESSIPQFMKLLGTFENLSGYKINISKTQTLTFNYAPSEYIRNNFKFNWNMKSIKYLGVEITQDFQHINIKNYSEVQDKIKKDIERWSTLPLDFSSRIEIVKMNILPRFLFLFQALPAQVSNTQFATWDKTISRFIWDNKSSRIKYGTLQLPKNKGGMALPKLKEYYIASQLRYLCCWCNPHYTGKWKNIECETLQEPIQNIIGDKELYETKKGI
uniref:Reverse transcriptase domain-containing protein n=1 Tax=Oryzias latipes TaxID=8090 RepID=A0A3B3I1X3_ORYLA